MNSIEKKLKQEGYSKYNPGERIDNAEEIIHRWYKKGDDWRMYPYIKHKKKYEKKI